MTEFTDVCSGRDVSVRPNGVNHGITHCVRDCQVVVDISTYIVGGDGDRDAQPCTVLSLFTQLDAVDGQLDVDRVTLYQSGRSGDAVVLVRSGIERNLADDRRGANAGHAQVSHLGLLEECLDRVVRGQSSATSGGQSPDQVLVLVKRRDSDGTVVGELHNRGFLGCFHHHVDCIETGAASFGGDSSFVNKGTRSASTTRNNGHFENQLLSLNIDTTGGIRTIPPVVTSLCFQGCGVSTTYYISVCLPLFRRSTLSIGFCLRRVKHVPIEALCTEQTCCGVFTQSVKVLVFVIPRPNAFGERVGLLIRDVVKRAS